VPRAPAITSINVGSRVDAGDIKKATHSCRIGHSRKSEPDPEKCPGEQHDEPTTGRGENHHPACSTMKTVSIPAAMNSTVATKESRDPQSESAHAVAACTTLANTRPQPAEKSRRRHDPERSQRLIASGLVAEHKSESSAADQADEKNRAPRPLSFLSRQQARTRARDARNFPARANEHSARQSKKCRLRGEHEGS
jgi:hypothetical protein